MRKIYALIVAMVAVCFATEAFAGTKNLYKQDFEAVSTPADGNWSSPNLAGGMSLTSTEYGQWFTFSLGNNNNRNALMNFESIFDGQSLSEYTVKFQWGFDKNTNNGGNDANNKNLQFSSEIALVTSSLFTSADFPDGYKLTTVINNGQYAANDSLRLFSLTQLKGAWAADADGNSTTPYWSDANDMSYNTTFYINGDTENRVELQEGMWYDIEVTVNTAARTAKYNINDLEGTPVANGTYNIPDHTSVWVKGINVLLGRYNAVASIDEVKVQVPVEGDYANTPTISLTELNMNQRSFDIYFEDGEILHVKKTEGGEDTAVESPYHYQTSTSGTLEAWTEYGTATSEHVTYAVDASLISLPAATVDITKVNSGYVKTLLMTVDNTTVPTQPNITLTWSYSNGDASTGEVASGAIYEASQKGVLTVTTHAYGFQSTTTTFSNDTEFAVDKSVDFQHLDEPTLLAKGFTEIDELRADNMSGENNWTARQRLWFGIENGEIADDGSAKYDTHVVYGLSTNTEAEGIRRFTLAPEKISEEVGKTMFAPVVTWYSATGDGTDIGGMKVNYGIGLINDGIKGGSTSIGYANAPISVDGLTNNDYYIVYVVSDYGSSSKHPIYPAGTSLADGKAMYKADNIGDGTNVQVKRGLETFDLYRIDTAISRIDVFKAVGGAGIETLPYNQVVSDHNAPVYNLNGVQVKGALGKGIYIKQGKKFVVK